MADQNQGLSTVNRGQIARDEFAGNQLQSSAETAATAVAARQKAQVEAMFVMAERHPRNWDQVRVRLMEHCDRPGFAMIARYKKPTGKRKINGQWVDTYAEGMSARFAEIARMEAGNISTESTVVYEDDLIRIIRASVMDLQRNNHDAREVTIAKAVEKRGKKNSQTGEWEPPEGREIIGNPRLNTYGEPVWLVKATDDEIRNKQNSEISKAQRDESLRLIPKDIRDDCEARVIAVLNDPKKTDPTAARKKMIDAFASIGVLPDDLVTYIGVPLDRLSPAQLDELRGLYTAIHDGETTFDASLKARFDQPAGTQQERDKEAQRRIDELEGRAKPSTSTPAPEQPKQEPKPAEPEPQLREYTKDTLPDAFDIPVGTRCRFENKILQVVEAPGEAPVWKTIEEDVSQGSAPAPNRERPSFGRGPKKP